MSTEQARNFGTLVLEVRDDDDRLKLRHTQGVHSYVDNWYGLVGTIFKTNTTQTITDKTDTDQTIELGTGGAIWGNNYSAYIAIGTGSASFSQSNTQLDTFDQRSKTSSISVNESNRLIRFSSTFSISSSKTISETGIELGGLNDTNGNGFDALFERTLLSSTVDVVNGDSLSVTYELEWAAP